MVSGPPPIGRDGARTYRGDGRGPSGACGLAERARRPHLRSRDPARFFTKWLPAGSTVDLADEAVRPSWAIAYTPVPRVLDQGTDEDGSWLVTAALPGQRAVAEPWTAEPRTAVTALGEGLRALHEALPAATCRSPGPPRTGLADARRRAAQGRIDASLWDVAHQPLGVDGAWNCWRTSRRPTGSSCATATAARRTRC